MRRSLLNWCGCIAHPLERTEMCGIIGLFNVAGRTVAEQAVGEAMNAAIWHRGPDGGGVYRDEQAMLGMRRLAIIDVQGGQQP
ncbi:hypothetical protein EO238_26340, partial [Citrobacter sp. AAK_AS5]